MILSTHGIIGSSGAVVSPNSTGLFAVYKAESNTNDSLGTYNGTPYGGLTYSAGKSGNAFTFNGTTAYVSLPNNMYSTLYNGSFSFSVWVNMASVAGYQAVFSSMKYDGTNANGINCFFFGNTLRFSIGNGSAVQVVLDSVTAISTSNWVHVVIVRKLGTSTKMYLNGALDNSNTSTTNPVHSVTTNVAIGAIDYTSNFGGIYYYFSNGSKIDELNSWNKELTAAEVTNLYNSGTGKFYPTF